MFGFVEKAFFIGLTILSSFTNASSLSCISMNNQACKARPEIINVNSNNPGKCSGNSNYINDPYAKICVPDVVKDLNVKVFNLMSRTNEIKNIKWHETCKCECRLDAIVCNNKQRWNKNKCRCECKELIDKGVSHKGLVWNLGLFGFIMIMFIMHKIINIKWGKSNKLALKIELVIFITTLSISNILMPSY